MKLLTLQEVSQMFGSNDPKGRMVRNLRAEGKLEAVKIGRRLLFTERSVEEYIRSQLRMQNKRAHYRPGDEVHPTSTPIIPEREKLNARNGKNNYINA